jgi:gas vesicle protein
MNNNERIYYSHDAEMQETRNRTIFTIIFMTLGLGLGAVVALLFAPASGKDTRDEIAGNVEDGVQTGRDKLEPTMKKLEKEFSEFRKSVEERLNHS